MARPPVGAYVLKTTFSLRGLVARRPRRAARSRGRPGRGARSRLAALVSRSPDLGPPLIVSAPVESLAENLTDSVVSPLLYYALFGLPGALAYRAINTMDAMLGYRDEREYVGKAAARSDDAANWVPTRIDRRCCWWPSPRSRGPPAAPGGRSAPSTCRSTGPNKTLAIATMAGSLGVQLQKPGAYALGTRGPAAAPAT